MTSEERLRQWAEKIKEDGPDLTQWADQSFIMAECLRMAYEFKQLREANHDDPLCESQDVDLDHHEADSPAWTCDPDSIKALITKLAETEKELDWTKQKLAMSYEANKQLDEERLKIKQQLTETRGLLEAILSDPSPYAGLTDILDWSRAWLKKIKAFLSRPYPEK